MITGIAEEELTDHRAREGDCGDVLLGRVASILCAVELLEDGVDLANDAARRSAIGKIHMCTRLTFKENRIAKAVSQPRHNHRRDSILFDSSKYSANGRLTHSNIHRRRDQPRRRWLASSAPSDSSDDLRAGAREPRLRLVRATRQRSCWGSERMASWPALRGMIVVEDERG